MRTRQHRQPDEVDVLVARRGRDLLGREPDALVDDLHARVARGDRDLLGAVGVAVEAGLAHEDADRVAELVGARLHPGSRPRPSPSPAGRVHAADAGRRAVLAEHLAQRARPLADGAAGACERDRGGHEVARVPAATSRTVVERARDRVGVALRRATPSSCSISSLLDRRVDHEDAGLAVERVDERRRRRSRCRRSRRRR